MVTVPIYGQPRVSAAPLPGQQVPTTAPLEAFGGGLSQPLQQVWAIAGDQMQLELQGQQDALEMQATEYKAKLSQEETRLKTVLGGIRGKDALKGHEQALKDFDAYQQALEKEIKEPELRDVVRRQYLAHKGNLDSWASPYAAAQLRDYDQEQKDATIRAEQEAIGVDWMPKRVAISIETQKAALRLSPRGKAMPPEQLELEEAKLESQSHARVIVAMLNAGQDLDAKRYFDQNKRYLLDRESDALARALEEGSLQGESLRHADEIWAKATSKEGVIGTEAFKAALEATEKIEDLEVRKRTQQEIQRLDALRRQANAAQREKDLEEAYTSALAGEMPQSTLLARLPVTDRQQVISMRNKAAQRKDVETDPQALLDFYSLSPEKRAALSHSEMLAARNYVSKSDWEEMVKARERDMRAVASKASRPLLQTDVKQQLQALGFGPDAKDNNKERDRKNLEMAEMMQEFKAAVDEAAAKGSPLKREEQRELLNQITRDRAIVQLEDSALFKRDTEKAVSKLKPEDLEIEWDFADFDRDEKNMESLQQMTSIVPAWGSLPEAEKNRRLNTALLGVRERKPDTFIQDILEGRIRWPW